MGSFPSVQPYSLNYATVNPGLGFHDFNLDKNFGDLTNLATDFANKAQQNTFVRQQLNGFYVQKLYPPPPPGQTSADVGLFTNYVDDATDIAIIADPLSTNLNSQNITAHEFAHILGADDSSDRNQIKDLMYHSGGQVNPCHLRREDWNNMNHPAGPEIFGRTPVSGPPGTTVTVSGANFGATPGQISLNGVSVTVKSWTPGTGGYADIITFVVPQNASTGPIQVTNSNGLFSTNNPTFTVTTP